MLKSWTVDCFKSITKKTTLDLAPLTIFAGENSSGKSTVIQSILLVAQTLQSNAPGRNVVLNGSILRLGSFNDILSGNCVEKRIGFGFEITPNSSNHSPYHYGRGIYLPEEYVREVASIKCDFSFSAEGSVGRENLQLHPRLQKSSIDVSYMDSEGKLKVEEVSIRRRSLNYEQLTAEDKLLSELVPANNPILDYVVERPRIYKPRYRQVSVKTGKPVGAVCKHFLPNYLAFSFDAVEALCNDAINSIRPERSGGGGNEAKGFELVANNQYARDKLLALLKEVAYGNKYGFRTQIESSIEKLSCEFSRENWLNVIRNIGIQGRRMLSQRLLEEETITNLKSCLKSNLPAQTDVAYGPFDSRIEQSAEYIEWFFSTSVKYIGPLRDEPKPLYPLGGGSESFDVGYKGELTAAVLDAHKYSPVSYITSADFISLGARAKTQGTTLAAAVQDWLRYIGVADGIETSDQGKLGHELRVTPVGSAVMHDLTHVGVGVSQLLPILVQALLMPSHAILILEQPELHLHPRVQSRLADFLVSLSLAGKQSIVETHSEYLINKLRFLSAKEEGDGISKLSKIYFVQKENGSSVYNPICINEFGVITNWPQGFFDEAEDLASETIKAAAKKRKGRLQRKTSSGFCDGSKGEV